MIRRDPSPVGPLRQRFARALVVSAPLAIFLLFSRFQRPNLYVSYRLPVLGQFPKGALFDLTLLLLGIAAWCAVASKRWARIAFLGVALPVIAFVLLFRFVDHYYYSSTRTPLNEYVLFGNLSDVQEGAGVVLHAPLALLLALAVAIHYVAYALLPGYSRFLRRIAERLATGPYPIVGPLCAVVLGLLALNLHAIMVHPHRRVTTIAMSGEYQLLSGLPRFFRDAGLSSASPAERPARLVLPEPVVPRPERSPRQPLPDIFLITVESFNYVYVLPPAELHPSLTEPLMPFFQSLYRDGFYFTRAYTSSAYTFNGITAVLCSQYTMSEKPWGGDCLPEVLARNGYDTFEFNAIRQLRPYRYDNYRAMGFDRSRVFDAVRMRVGKPNVFFDLQLDDEILKYAGTVADSLASRADRRPMFLHVSTDQMHVPGYSSAGCRPYRFPGGLSVDATTRNMLNSAHCTDQDLAAFVAHLKQRGLYDKSLIIITADHAFNVSFWSHQENELARIPLFIKFPASAGVGAIDTAQLVAQVDLAPTIIDFLGLHSSRPMYGRSLLEVPPVPRQRVTGISSSRLLSMATPAGIVFHVHGAADLEDREVRGELDALFGTVLYFDQHPDLFDAAVRSLGAPPSRAAHQ